MESKIIFEDGQVVSVHIKPFDFCHTIGVAYPSKDGTRKTVLFNIPEDVLEEIRKDSHTYEF